jgi:hypothetical protein
MNQAQLRRAQESRASAPATAGGWWCASGQGGFTIGSVRFPRGARVPDEIIATIAPNKLAILQSGGHLQYRLDAVPASAPAPVKIARTDDAAEQAAMVRNMKAAGVLPGPDVRVGCRGMIPQGHPSTAVQLGKGDVR